MVGKNNRVTMLYDGDCPLCRREVAHYQRIDKQHRVDWVDINGANDLQAEYGVDYESAMARLHVVDRQGRLLSGVRAFVTLWQMLPYYHYLASVVVGLRLERPLEWLYVRFARWRLKDRCTDDVCSVKRKD